MNHPELPSLFVGTINGSPHAIQGLRHTMVNDIAFCARADEAAEIVRRCNAYPRLIAALKQYVDVVSNVDDPNDFRPKVKDEGHHARDLLLALGEAN